MAVLQSYIPVSMPKVFCSLRERREGHSNNDNFIAYKSSIFELAMPCNVIVSQNYVFDQSHFQLTGVPIGQCMDDTYSCSKISMC